MRRARREAPRHAPCDRHSVFSAVAQTLQDGRGYSSQCSPATALCSSSLGRIRAPRPAPSLSAPSSSAFLLPFLRFSPLQRALRSTGKFSQDPGEDIHEMVKKSRSALRRSASLSCRQTQQASPESLRRWGLPGFRRRETAHTGPA